MGAQLLFEVLLWLLFILSAIPIVQMCSPAHGLVHVSWDNRHEVQYQLDCTTWGYFCQDSGWGDEAATAVCRELGYSYGTSGYVPITREYVVIDGIRCQGEEERLQDCAIEPAASNSRSVCSSVGIITACHNHLPHVYMSAQKVSVPEDDSFQVCVHINGTLTSDITMSLYTVDGSALADFDYLPVGHQLQFVVSDSPMQCADIQLVDDHLAEEGEWFGIQLSADTTAVEVVNSQLRLVIEPSDVDSHCSEGSVTVVSDVFGSSLQLVEMCSSEGVWSPVCDHDWTLEDATVVCTELGYNNSGDVLYAFGSSVRQQVPVIPECEGDERRLVDCLQHSRGNTSCYTILVDCMSQEEEDVEEETKGEETGNESVPTGDVQDDEQTKERERDGGSDYSGLGAILGIATSIILMAVLVLTAAVVIMGCLCCKSRPKSKLVPGQSAASQRAWQETSDQGQHALENSLRTNCHTTPPNVPGSPVEHIYSSILDPPPPQPMNHNYDTLVSLAGFNTSAQTTELSREQEESDGHSVVHQYAVLDGPIA